MSGKNHRLTQAVIMAGGKGTRLRPYTYVLPKPLVPIGEKPILEYILRQLAAADITDVCIVLGYKGDLLHSVIGDGRRFGLTISYYTEDQPLGTMGALPLLPNLHDNFLVLNGDLCTDLQLRDFANAHMDSDAPFSISVYHCSHKMEFGVLDIDHDSGRAIGFREKPLVSLWVSMGIYALQRELVQYIPPHTYFGFDNLMHSLLEKNIPINTVPFAGRWHDIGRPEDYFLVQDAYEKQGDALFGLR